MSKIIISAPLVFPKIEPDDWGEWWKVWSNEATPVKKVRASHNNLLSPWIGFDLYVAPGKEESAKFHYDFKNINRPDLFSNFFSNIKDFPIDIDIIRVSSTFCSVQPHKDFTEPMYSVRTMLYDNNPTSTWYYLFDDKKVYLNLPKDTNTWIYPDHESRHGTDYRYPYKKILLMFFGKLKEGYPEITFNKSLENYSDYIIFK